MRAYFTVVYRTECIWQELFAPSDAIENWLSSLKLESKDFDCLKLWMDTAMPGMHMAVKNVGIGRFKPGYAIGD